MFVLLRVEQEDEIRLALALPLPLENGGGTLDMLRGEKF